MTTTRTPLSRKLASLAVAAGVAAAGIFAGQAAKAEELRYAIGFPANTASTIAADVYVKKVQELSKGTLSVKVFPLSLLNLAETPGGVRDGITDIGYVLTAYNPAEFANMNLAGDLTMLLNLMDTGGRDGLIFQSAMLEYVFLHCPTCQNDMKAQNQVFTASAASTRYMLLCNKKVTNAEEIKGKRLRVSSQNWRRWSESVGATAVSMPGNEIFEALTQGAVDCAIISAPELSGLALIDAVSDITPEVPGGVFGASAIANINVDTWQGLNEDQRAALLRAGTYMSAHAGWQYVNFEGRDLKRAEAKGIRIHKADQALIDQTQSFVQGDMKTIAEFYASKFGVAEPQAAIDTFRPLLEKWAKIVKEVKTPDELAEVYWTEVVSKVDVKTYGM